MRIYCSGLCTGRSMMEYWKCTPFQGIVWLFSNGYIDNVYVKYDYKTDVERFSCDNPSHMTVLDWINYHGDPHLIGWRCTSKKWKLSNETQREETAPMFSPLCICSIPICYETCIASILKSYRFHSLKHWYTQHIFGPNVPCPDSIEAIFQTLVNHIYSPFLREAKMNSVRP
jgi:hypothetical protein